MIIDEVNSKHIMAEEGKVLRQVSSLVVFGKEVFLGTVLIDDELVEDTVSNFEEIDEGTLNKNENIEE